MKSLYKIGMLAVAALAFAGCSKEVDNSAEQTTGTHTLTFTVQKDVDTRTAVEEGNGVASYVWTEGDEEYFVIFENDKKATEVVMSNLSSDHKIATFKATFNDSDATSFTYSAVYGSSVSNSKNPLIPYEQSPALTSFDPAADALVSAEDIVLEEGAKADEDTEFQFRLRRVVSANKMTLKGLEEGEKITKVELASSDCHFTARYTFDGGEYRTQEGSQKLILDYSKVNATVGSDGTFPVYFTCAPVENASFSVKVMTDSHLYYRDNFTSKLTLAVGTFRRFGINLADYGSPLQQATEYKLVEDNTKIADGAEYLIVAKGQNKAAGSLNTSGSTHYYNAEGVTVNNKVISITSEAVEVFTLEAGTVAGQFNIKDSEGKYMKWSSGNSADHSDSPYLWTVTTGGITSVKTTDRSLKYNSGSPRFACYTSGQTDIELYVNEATLIQKLATPVIECEPDGNDVFVNWGAVEGAGSYKVTCTGEDDITTTDTGVIFEGLDDGFYTITVTAIAGSSSYRDSDPASADVKIGTPDLAKPVIESFTETNTGFNAVITAAVPYAESYVWDLYVGSVDKDNWIGTGVSTALSFSGTFDDMLITEYEAGETYIIVVTAVADGFNGTESDPASFVAVGPTYDFTTVAELNKLAQSTAATKNGKLTDAVVSFVPNPKNAFIKDATGTILLYVNTTEGHGLVQGQTYSGSLTVSLALYNSCAQITSCSASFTGSGAMVEPENVALSDLVGNLATYQNAYVQVDNLLVVSKSGKNINVSNGSNTYVVYDNTQEATCVAGDVISAKGTITHYDKDNIDELKVWAASDITITTPHTPDSHTITFAQPEEGGSFTVKVGDDAIESGEELEEGTIVTLKATASEGYVFNGWTVVGATVNGNETATFTVGTSDVDITASFKLEQNGKWTIVGTLNDLTAGKYTIAALNSGKYYAVPATTINGQTFTCIESSYSEDAGLTPGTGSGEFEFTAVEGVENAYYIYNTSLKKYLVATGSKKFGYVDSSSSDYGYWTFSTVSSGGFSGQFSVKHDSKTHYMRAYNNSVRCYDGASNNGVYLFILK